MRFRSYLSRPSIYPPRTCGPTQLGPHMLLLPCGTHFSGGPFCHGVVHISTTQLGPHMLLLPCGTHFSGVHFSTEWSIYPPRRWAHRGTHFSGVHSATEWSIYPPRSWLLLHFGTHVSGVHFATEWSIYPPRRWAHICYCYLVVLISWGVHFATEWYIYPPRSWAHIILVVLISVGSILPRSGTYIHHVVGPTVVLVSVGSILPRSGPYIHHAVGPTYVIATLWYSFQWGPFCHGVVHISTTQLGPHMLLLPCGTHFSGVHSATEWYIYPPRSWAHSYCYLVVLISVGSVLPRSGTYIHHVVGPTYVIATLWYSFQWGPFCHGVVHISTTQLGPHMLLLPCGTNFSGVHFASEWYLYPPRSWGHICYCYTVVLISVGSILPRSGTYIHHAVGPTYVIATLWYSFQWGQFCHGVVHISTTQLGPHMLLLPCGTYFSGVHFSTEWSIYPPRRWAHRGTHFSGVHSATEWSIYPPRSWLLLHFGTHVSGVHFATEWSIYPPRRWAHICYCYLWYSFQGGPFCHGVVHISTTQLGPHNTCGTHFSGVHFATEWYIYPPRRWAPLWYSFQWGPFCHGVVHISTTQLGPHMLLLHCGTHFSGVHFATEWYIYPPRSWAHICYCYLVVLISVGSILPRSGTYIHHAVGPTVIATLLYSFQWGPYCHGVVHYIHHVVGPTYVIATLWYSFQWGPFLPRSGTYIHHAVGPTYVIATLWY